MIRKEEFFEELYIPRPDRNLWAGSASHGKQTADMLAGMERRREMKYALIGCGRIATNHVTAALNNHLVITAVCDRYRERIACGDSTLVH